MMPAHVEHSWRYFFRKLEARGAAAGGAPLFG
jgi:hypothetical protein